VDSKVKEGGFMNELQSIVDEFNKEGNFKVDKYLRIIDLSSELGEVCKLCFMEGTGRSVELSKWQDELGDVLYSLLSLMTELNIDSEKALLTVLEKYKIRYLKKHSIDSCL
jgi:NTP pyrophosphatase (non-canonical NTP hydrolase)